MFISAAFRVLCRGFLLASVLTAQVMPCLGELLRFGHQGVERNAIVVAPAQAASPSPLIIALHGIGGSGENFANSRLFETLAEREGFVTVYPTAIEGQWNYGKPLIRPMPMAGGETVDDVGFLRQLIDNLIERKIADPARIYVMGVSRGGMMAFTVACALADRVAAVAALITPMSVYQREGCRPVRPVPIMLIAGTHDPSQPYDGVAWPLGRLMSVAETMDFWRQQHGCTQRSGRMLPHRDPADRTRVMRVEWASCRGVSPLLYRIEGGGHQVPSIRAEASPMSVERFGPRNRDIESSDEMWTFFKRFRL